MEVHRANLDSLAQTGLPLYVTEMDIDGPTDAEQLASYQRVFPVFWEHPAVNGITLWGYRQNFHWRNAQGAWLVWSQAGSDGAERPAMQWIHRYVANKPPVADRQLFTVPGSAPDGSTIGTVVATDPDSGTVFSQWQIETSGPYAAGNGNGFFAINPANGTLSVANAAALSAVPKGTALKIYVSVWDGYVRSVPSRVEVYVN